VAGHFHIGFNGSNINPPSSDLFLGDDYNYVKLPGSQIDPNNQHGVEIGANARDSGGSHVWRFETDGSIRFPDNTVQTTAYTGQTSSSGELYIMANVDGDIVTSTNGIDWTAPQASGMNGIQRVEIHNGVIVYISGGDMEGAVRGLYYSTELGTVTLCAGTDISTETDNDLFWQQVHYFAGSDKWVAVGYNDGDTNKFPVLAHSDNGITWTVVFVDNTFVTGFNTEDYDWRLTDVAWLDETNQYVITSFLDGPGATGGIFITGDITVALDGTTHVAIDFNARSVVPWSVVGFEGPPGYMILIPSVGGSSNILSGWGTDPEDYDDSFGLWESTFIDELGYAPALTEVAYKNGDFIGVTNDGQVATIDFGIGGPALIISIPLPYTNTVFSISNANPAVITWGMGNSNEANNEKIVVTLAGEYNGTYYVNSSTRVLYTDLAMTTALDASGFAAFTSGTVTFSHGQYFDAAGASNSYYYIGNDDEQVFRSSNGITWTQQADFTGEYFNDFAYGSFGTANANTGNFTFDEDTITNNNGLILSTNRGTLAIGTNMETPGVAGHFHIGFDGGNINPPPSDLFLGDDYNYVKLPGSQLDPNNQHGVEIGTDNRGAGPQNVEVNEVDELVPPGGVWRLFIDHDAYPNLGSLVSVGDTVTTSWGTPITATITDVVEEPGNSWKIHVAQDITAGFLDEGETVSFGTPSDSYTWRFGTDGTLTLPSGNTRIGNVFGEDGMVGNTGTGVGVGSQGQGGYAALQWIDDPEDATSVAAVIVNSQIGSSSGTVQIATGLVGGPTAENVWEFDANGVLTLPTNGTISYTPDDTDNWNDPAVNTIQAALDELAARVTALQNFEIDGGNAYTPELGELLIDGNGA
jgi:hypothetical protein